jgi:2Fe-2S ferredoxin
MPKVIFIESNGTRHEVEAKLGRSAMQAAVDNAVPGILADCGGACSCATCHGYVREEFLGRLPPKGEEEQMMLDGVLELRQNSRLTCQIEITEALDGICIDLPVSQL